MHVNGATYPIVEVGRGNLAVVGRHKKRREAVKKGSICPKGGRPGRASNMRGTELSDDQKRHQKLEQETPGHRTHQMQNWLGGGAGDDAYHHRGQPQVEKQWFIYFVTNRTL